ncbi:MAG: helix-turn-helix transcriptional regulator [Acidobacteria bacterium]|nr:helix-turn-helix transcriptional regulator [Acidobacteriota bacterium]
MTTKLPLKPDVFLILMILIDGDAHGYGIIKEAEARTDGELKLQAGALYRRLKWMLDEGLIGEIDERPTGSDDRRRYYRISALGIEAVKAEATRMARLVDAARARDLVKDPSR